ncbi:hypothetical protein D8674_025058 [Pyrus ussuriensis x Pyrus communis]|uniref:Uncharacterized protein n=1 Tax=Pyrus ussuriensis x Pyrus communis TaxID=2448454 RepID=A0A5N5H4L4_9ROSA|nr:hypothetical protein D8674_025058 [Pyrus ussuriensis x Pyrus communis]
MASTYSTSLVVSMMVILSLRMITEIQGQSTGSTNFAPPPQVPGSNLLQANNVSEPLTQSDDTVRVDPLDDLKKYRGGYNITNKHYWSSTIFTGIHGYALGMLWLLCGILYGCFLLATKLCCKNRKSGKLKKRLLCHKQCYLWQWHIFLAIFFTVFAIVAFGLVLGGNARFHSQAKSVVDIIITTANEASGTVYNTTGAMKEMSNNFDSTGNTEVSSFLTSTSQKLDTAAADIERQAKKNRRLIDKGLKIVYIVTTVPISLGLVAVIALSVSGVLKLRRLVQLLIVLCWLLTTLFWVFFGLYFFLAEFSNDTCTALESFQQNPNNNSLSSILPCDELVSAKSLLHDVGAGIYSLVNEVNANISSLQETSSQNIEYVCNPFSEPPEYNYQPQKCPNNSVPIGDIPEVLRVDTCSDANSGTCENGTVISDSAYKLVELYTSSIQGILNSYPGMESLVECQTVKDAFSEILVKHCKPLKRYAKMVWAAMAFLATLMVLLVLLWIIQANHERNHHSADGSVSATENVVELGTATAVMDNPNPSLA